MPLVHVAPPLGVVIAMAIAMEARADAIMAVGVLMCPGQSMLHGDIPMSGLRSAVRRVACAMGFVPRSMGSIGHGIMRAGGGPRAGRYDTLQHGDGGEPGRRAMDPSNGEAPASAGRLRRARFPPSP
mmetsp:Transcript_24481/g.70290  ORF Transcript_24481/g.70290 Transcript_24481/m.70290 type:complete len:127 (+) Transcript_24481:1937-2317(+)